MSEGREATLSPEGIPAQAYAAQCIQKLPGKGANSEPSRVPKSL